MNNGHIFISYRRDDSAGYTRAIYDQLVQHFFKDRVFMDVEGIEPGLAFDEAIIRAVGQCEVLLVMIGRRWLEEQTGAGPRLNDPNDFVRLEIATALSRQIRVIPVLIDGARMPAKEALPEPLRALALRNAIEVSNSRFNYDANKLIEVVRKALGEPDKTYSTLRSILYWVAGGLTAFGLAFATYYFFYSTQSPRATSTDCLGQVLSGVNKERRKSIESGPGEVVIVDQDQQPKDGDLGIELTEHGKPIGALTFALFASDTEYPTFKDIRLYDANCGQPEDYSNETRGGDRHQMINWDYLQMHLEGRVYQLRLGYNENSGKNKGRGEIKVVFSQVSPGAKPKPAP
jgi:hypothetical protein